jgi:hypothetical protein
MLKSYLKGFFKKTMSNKQASDTGMASVLILLLIGLFAEKDLFIKFSILLLIINMSYPKFFYPFAIIWFGLSKFLGTVLSKIILTILYITMIMPVGLLRRLIGKDSLKLSEFKKDTNSVMKTRDIYIVSEDIEKPY